MAVTEMERNLSKMPVWVPIVVALGLVCVAAGGMFYLKNGSVVRFADWHILLGVFVAMAACGCEFIDSSLGMGYGTTLTPLLLLAGFEPLQVVPAILVSELCTGLLAGVVHQHEGNLDLHQPEIKKTTVILSSLSLAGATLAVLLALKMSTKILGTMIGAIIVTMGIVILFTLRQTFKFRISHIVLLGAVAAFNKGLSGGGYGPLVTGGQVVCGVSPKQAVGITSLAEAATCLVALLVYLVGGKELYLPLVVPLLIGAMSSVPFSAVTIKRLEAIKVRAAIGIGTLILGILSLSKIWF